MPRPLWQSGEEPNGPLFGDLQFVVAGTNRGGTQYFAALLRDMGGLRVKHEGLLTTERNCREYSRYWDCEVSGGNVHMLPQVKAAGVPIFHLVRHPLGTINSIWDKWRNNDGFKKRFWIGPDDAPPAEAMGRWWLKHRQQIDECTDDRFYLEDDHTASLWRIAKKVRIDWPTERMVRVVKARKPVGARKRPVNCFGWSDLPEEVRDYARKLGYTG